MDTVQFGPSIERDGYLAGLPLSGPITSRFGARDIAEHASGHTGTDIGAPVGTPVLAPAPGVVTAAVASGGVFGTYVTVAHGGGFESLYAHLSRLDVVTGERVMIGSVLGRVGVTGLTTGPHLHWGLARGGSPLQRGPHLRDALDFCSASAAQTIDEERLWHAVANGVYGALQAVGAVLGTHSEEDFAGYAEGSPERAILGIQRAANGFLARWLPGGGSR